MFCYIYLYQFIVKTRSLMYNVKHLCLAFWIALIASNLRAQDITPHGAGALKLGMTTQQFKTAFPGAQIRRESHEGDDETIGIIVRDGMISAKATFYGGKIYALSLYDRQYKLNGVPILALFQDLKSKIKIKSIFYAPDGEEAGITIRLTDMPQVNINIELMGALKSMLSKYAYNEVPVDKLPDWSKIESISITQSQVVR